MVYQNNSSKKKPDRIVPSKVYQQRKPKGVTAAIVENDLVRADYNLCMDILWLTNRRWLNMVDFQLHSPDHDKKLKSYRASCEFNLPFSATKSMRARFSSSSIILFLPDLWSAPPLKLLT